MKTYEVILTKSYIVKIQADNELKVAAEFWDFLGGQGAYNDLLDIFERIGLELRPEIEDYFARYNRQ